MYIIYVNHDSVIKQICQLRDKAFLINETDTNPAFSVYTEIALAAACKKADHPYQR